MYDHSHCSAFVHDISSDNDLPIHSDTIDLVCLIFVLSAVPQERSVLLPDSFYSFFVRFHNVLHKLFKVLKPGGKILFRDYGQFDLAQLRFKPGKVAMSTPTNLVSSMAGQCLADNQYVRGDNTLVYFFTQGTMHHVTVT